MIKYIISLLILCIISTIYADVKPVSAQKGLPAILDYALVENEGKQFLRVTIENISPVTIYIPRQIDIADTEVVDARIWVRYKKDTSFVLDMVNSVRIDTGFGVAGPSRFEKMQKMLESDSNELLKLRPFQSHYYDMSFDGAEEIIKKSGLAGRFTLNYMLKRLILSPELGEGKDTAYRLLRTIFKTPTYYYDNGIWKPE
jgi:hypothetical protein